MGKFRTFSTALVQISIASVRISLSMSVCLIRGVARHLDERVFGFGGGDQGGEVGGHGLCLSRSGRSSVLGWQSQSLQRAINEWA